MSDQSDRQATPQEFPDETPGDKSFGEAAREKQEAADAAEASGADLPPESGDAPRAGGKADPA
ncbi:MAG TPA: hypothetical protein VFP61_04580 [Acidimicrobiales bacterium]|nr:hypothetical protein [Acidimicrobiales bacterium]